MSRYQKGKPIWISLKQETVSGSGISWAVCKSAHRSRRIATPAHHHSVFTGRMPFCRPANSVKALKTFTHAISVDYFRGLVVQHSRRPIFRQSATTRLLLCSGKVASLRAAHYWNRFIAGGDGDVGGHIGGARSAPCHVTCSGSSSSRREASAATDYGLYPEGVVRRFSAVNIRRFYSSPTYLLTYSLSRCPSASECNAESDSVLSQTLESCPINKLDGGGWHSASPLR